MGLAAGTATIRVVIAGMVPLRVVGRPFVRQSAAPGFPRGRAGFPVERRWTSRSWYAIFSSSRSPTCRAPFRSASLPRSCRADRIRGTVGSGRTGGTKRPGGPWVGSGALVVVSGDLLKGALPIILGAAIVTNGDAVVEVGLRVRGGCRIRAIRVPAFRGRPRRRDGRGHDAGHPAHRRAPGGAGVRGGDPGDPLRLAGLHRGLRRTVPGDAHHLSRCQTARSRPPTSCTRSWDRS